MMWYMRGPHYFRPTSVYSGCDNAQHGSTARWGLKDPRTCRLSEEGLFRDSSRSANIA